MSYCSVAQRVAHNYDRIESCCPYSKPEGVVDINGMSCLRRPRTEFAEQIEVAKVVSIERLEYKLYTLGMNGNVTACIVMMKKFKPEEYRETRALMSPKELEATLERELQSRAEVIADQIVERKLRELGISTAVN